MKSYLQDQRGIAMVFELALVAVVIGLVGFAFVTSSHVKQASVSNNPKAAVIATPSSVPNGNVDNAVNALSQDSVSDSTAASDDSSVPSSAATDTSSQNVGGSYDESSF